MAKRRKLYVGCPVRVIDLRSRELSWSSFWKSRSHEIGIVTFLEPEGYEGSLNTQVQFSNGMSVSYDWGNHLDLEIIEGLKGAAS